MTNIWCLKGELPLERAQELEILLETMGDERGEFPPTLSYFEQAPDADWVVEVFFAEKPEDAFVGEILKRGSLEDWVHEFSPVENKDWVSESQKLLSPVEAGRFYVFGAHDKNKARAGAVNLQIDAGQAFGTGKHETTAACLEVLDALASEIIPATVLDLGTGSGVLALGAHKVWPEAKVVASDIDPIAVHVTDDNIGINGGVAREMGENRAGIATLAADGLDDPAFTGEKPFDLIMANILAGPLIELSGDITAALADKATLVLSGLLGTQKKEVLEAYKARGLVSLGRVEKGEWLALTLRKP
ncbi:50S ribosomal protein L11 methyltransferase [Kordiimonas aestuarii]|uniref:50S ribosomal protein L11 methyltransferase n=1 Tax=Kordiimonas aestuarii TaxID=1005925 RepID=UPI0021CEAFB6|nr:50S ribosomal protein L11 methyltransferase [Kordiimonas aestuarii]